MRGIEKELIEFQVDDRAEIHRVVRSLAASGTGWVNIEPIVAEEDLAGIAKGGVRRLLSSKGPAIPFATYVPKESGAKRPTPQSIGLQHGAGPKIVDALSAASVNIPDRWYVQDQASRRGMVVLVPDDVDAESIVAFIIDAAQAVSEVPLRDWWSAVVHRPAKP